MIYYIIVGTYTERKCEFFRMYQTFKVFSVGHYDDQSSIDCFFTEYYHA